TFNMLKESGKQMVFTSDRPPRELKTITDRLLSRFASGLVADIKPPDLETRKAIIKKKAHQKDVGLSEEIIHFLANNITQNVRDLEAAVTKVKSIVELLNEKLTLKRVEIELHDVLNSYVGRKNVSVERVQKEVANYYNISYSDMKSKKRTSAIAKPRQIAVYLSKQLTNLSTTELGNEFGGRNHSTIISACQKIDREIQANESTQNDVEHLKIRLLRS
ncbi:MAG TPA: chromosomal replication initiator protein DnaA, partial [Spirochaetes bacterium]|nr:chromosomal replication initiator protein DnaA [Spirochaetota bacterium]